MLPVPEGAVDLLEAVHDVVAGDGPDGFRASQLVDEREDGTLANKVAGYHRLAQLAGLDVTERTVYDWVHALEDVGLLHPERYEQHAGVSYAVDSATLKSALSVLSNNGGFKVAATRRLRSLLQESGSGLEWLAWARDVFTLHGAGDDTDSPPDRGGTGV
jgi:transposase